MADSRQSLWHAISERWESFLSGGRNADPLYIYNRTFKQRLTLWLKILAPCLLLVGAVSYGLFYRLRARDKAPAELPSAQVAAKMLPGLNKPIDLGTSHFYEVEEAHLEPAAPLRLVGTLRNNGEAVSGNVYLAFELMDQRGSRLGAVSTTLSHVPAHGSTEFALPVPQADAWAVIVTQIEAR